MLAVPETSGGARTTRRSGRLPSRPYARRACPLPFNPSGPGPSSRAAPTSASLQIPGTSSSTLCATDLTTEGTYPVSATCSKSIDRALAEEDRVWFTVSSNPNGSGPSEFEFSLWSTDGTPGTESLELDGSAVNIVDMIVAQERLVLRAKPPDGSRLVLTKSHAQPVMTLGVLDDSAQDPSTISLTAVTSRPRRSRGGSGGSPAARALFFGPR